jgi:hypothetical protein
LTIYSISQKRLKLVKINRQFIVDRPVIKWKLNQKSHHDHPCSEMV